MRWWAVLVAAFVVAGCSSGAPGPAPSAATGAAATVPADFAAFGRLTAPGTRPVSGQLRGPHFAYALIGAGTVATAPAGLGLPPGAVPAPGQDLFVATMTAAAPAYDDQDPTVELVVDGDARPVTVTALSGTVAASIPTGAAPLLRVTDAGRAQTLDLRTGERGPDAIAGYYPAPAGDWTATGPAGTTLRLGGPATAALSVQDRAVTVGLAGVDGGLQPWTPERGWARDGRAWLVLRPRVTYVRQNAEAGRSDTVTVAAGALSAAGVRLTGAALRLTTSGDDPATGEATGSYVAEVPIGFRRTLAVRFAFAGTISLSAGPATWTPLSSPNLGGSFVLR